MTRRTRAGTGARAGTRTRAGTGTRTRAGTGTGTGAGTGFADFSVETSGGSVGARHFPASAPSAIALVLAHGAGAPQSSAWLVGYARALSARGLDVVTFDFPYMHARRKLPDRAPVLEQCYRDVALAVRARLPGRKLALGGKSMGGRIATQVAAADGPSRCDALVTLGYPLHPPGRPEKLRVAHLPAIAVPWLIVQGERDEFGSPGELRPYLARLDATLEVVSRGDHSFKAPKSDGDPHPRVQDAIARWLADRLR